MKNFGISFCIVRYYAVYALLMHSATVFNTQSPPRNGLGNALCKIAFFGTGLYAVSL